MSNSSSRDVPGSTVRELGLPARAVTALHRAGVDTVADLAALTRAELSGIAGLGPGSIAAIRAVVPEPSTGTARPAQTRPAQPRPAQPRPAQPRTEPEPVEEESPDAPAIPSFDSLRRPRRRTAFDLLVPATS
ncbi:DNA-directed RNA polymerase subunit alpha C-terminal domain-containing protein, partial [Modestobacter marinus]|uniref:DNA-directed RNA polymerase subunit alpha C-terminal domain-containing protein n=1 Tax=Modestobacter marinus TaxID=477641 RepID=UPI00201A3DAF